MSQKNKNLNSNIMSDDESLSDNEYLTSVLSMVNGYCKINLVVPQTTLFYSSDSLLPINAKVNDIKLNNNVHQNRVINTPDSLTNILKNINLKANENIDDKKFDSLNKTYVDEFQVYSKQSYSDNSNLLEKTEENKSEPKGKKKKNKFSKVSLSDNQTLVPSSTHTDQNCSNEYFNQFESEVLSDGHIKQDEELRKKQTKNIINSISNNGHQLRSRASHSHQNPENEITNKNMSQSQCPLCFVLYPTPDIEAHASECSI
ncbi:PREDICTED: uncharacterized protein LOC107168345 isoform X1 [Diuraphis noxia]|uniref:uncharacterized protein LOC107168345 isoform X1 n=1 Tax=Diuraphis noxia TaxID=143948 RepID=UPI000763B2DA|nr:PREDICTED: uncharacterized protein LOC107168345 isoform X1 [Diuraphis noxia]